MHRLKRIRNNIHSFRERLHTWRQLSQTWLLSTFLLGCAAPVRVTKGHIWSFGLGLLRPNKGPGRCWGLMRARTSDNASAALTAGYKTTQTRLKTRRICNVHLIEHKQAEAAKVNRVKAAEMPGHLLCRFRIHSSLTRQEKISSIKVNTTHVQPEFFFSSQPYWIVLQFSLRPWGRKTCSNWSCSNLRNTVNFWLDLLTSFESNTRNGDVYVHTVLCYFG